MIAVRGDSERAVADGRNVGRPGLPEVDDRCKRQPQPPCPVGIDVCFTSSAHIRAGMTGWMERPQALARPPRSSDTRTRVPAAALRAIVLPDFSLATKARVRRLTSEG